MTQRVIQIHSPRFIPEDQLHEAFRPTDCFSKKQPLALEVGCGIGDFIRPLATARPETNFLAIDIYNQGCLKTSRRVDEAGLDNVRVMRVEARHLIAHYLDPQTFSAVYINCPDPWPKKRHRERRLMSPEFLAMLRYAIQPGGDLYFASDIQDYAEQVAELVTPECGFVQLSDAPFTTTLPTDYPISKYMRRFLDLGQPIHFLHLRRRADDLTPARPSEVRTGFRVRREAVARG